MASTSHVSEQSHLQGSENSKVSGGSIRASPELRELGGSPGGRPTRARHAAGLACGEGPGLLTQAPGHRWEESVSFALGS